MATIINTPSSGEGEGFSSGLIIGIIVVVVIIILFFVMRTNNNIPADQPDTVNITVPADNDNPLVPNIIENNTINNSTTTINSTTTTR